MRVYLDNAATTPLDATVIEAMHEAMKNVYGNPSSIHKDGRLARATVEDARKTVAECLNASIGEIFFTSGGTESNNMVLKCAVRDLGVERIISSPIEHHCILHTLDSLQKHQGIEVILLDIDQYGVVDYQQLEEYLNDITKKTLVSLMHANNEVGTMLDIERVAHLCQEKEALFHSDTVQTIGTYRYDLEKLPIHFLSGSGHKFYGPKGTGFVYINSETSIAPFIDGGAQERNMRAGTENIYGIVGVAKALEMAYENLEERINKVRNLRAYLKEKLSATFEDIQFNAHPNLYLEKVLSVSFPPSPKADLLLLNLDIAGISASGGSACSSGAETASHVLSALNFPEDRKAIRFSFSHHNTKEELDFVVEKLKKVVELKALV